MAAAETTFTVMGCSAQIIITGGTNGGLARAERRLNRLEDLWTRFSMDSEISQVNSNAGGWTDVSPETVALLQLSELGWRMTDGLFDPTGLPALLAAGYVSSRTDSDRRTEGVRPSSLPSPGCDGFLTTESAVFIPAGVTIDSGGIGKGLAADIVATELRMNGPAAIVVNVGGDLRVIGGSTVDIEDPFQEGRTIARLRIAEGGVATSTPSHRRWRSDDGKSVHIIDPRTGQPVETDVESVTVIAGETWIAEVVAKAAAIVGTEAAPALIDRFGLAGLVVSTNGKVSLSSRLVEFLL